MSSSLRRTTTSRQSLLKLNSRLYNTPAPFGNQYGPGGRHSNSGITATVFGAYGFVGRYFMNELGQCGSRAYAPFRGCENDPRLLKPMFDLGQLGLMPFHPRDDESIRQSLKNSNVVINMIGKHYETKHLVPHRNINGKPSRVNFTMDEMHSEIPGRIAKIAKEMGVESFIHMSSQLADSESTCDWARSKAHGEKSVKSEFPEAIIVRPNTVFGPEDRFLNWIAELNTSGPFMPLIDGGNALLQPVHCVDVAKGLMAIVNEHEECAGKIFEFSGPAEYSYKEVTEFVQDVTTVRKPIVAIPSQVAKYLGQVTENMIEPQLTADGVTQMTLDVLPTGDYPSLVDLGIETSSMDKVAFDYPSLVDLGIETSSMDKVAFDYLHRFRPGGHFAVVEGYH